MSWLTLWPVTDASAWPPSINHQRSGKEFGWSDTSRWVNAYKNAIICQMRKNEFKCVQMKPDENGSVQVKMIGIKQLRMKLNTKELKCTPVTSKSAKWFHARFKWPRQPSDVDCFQNHTMIDKGFISFQMKSDGTIKFIWACMFVKTAKFIRALSSERHQRQLIANMLDSHDFKENHIIWKRITWPHMIFKCVERRQLSKCEHSILIIMSSFGTLYWIGNCMASNELVQCITTNAWRSLWDTTMTLSDLMQKTWAYLFAKLVYIWPHMCSCSTTR